LQAVDVHPEDAKEGGMKDFLARSWHEEEGRNSAEYALIFILICLVVVAALQLT
jgi:Flp pilus assembly pilin Flp